MRAVPELLDQAQRNIKNPPPTYIRIARQATDDAIAFYETAANELAGTLPELSVEITRAADEAVSAMKTYRTFLDNVEPGPVGSFAIGKQNFDYKLKYEYMLDIDSDSLLKIGEALLTQINERIDAYDHQLNENGSGVDSVYIVNCIEKEDVLGYYQWETEQVKRFLREKDILTVPDNIGECKVIETPVFLRALIGSIAYQPPGAFSPAQTGYFYVRPIPDNMDDEEKAARYRYIHRRGFKGSVVHEAYPGHHLHFQLTAGVADSVRKWQLNAMSYEGWALYSEEMMYDKGLYGNDIRPLRRILTGIKFRAARIIADVKLHTGQFTRDEALAWFAGVMDKDTTGWIVSEIDRYTLQPTIQMSYLIGKIELLDLLEAVRKKEGDGFSLKSFHDRFLSEGTIPPRMLWDMWGLKE
jgi:uncharacterized protein (DUF885 family)